MDKSSLVKGKQYQFHEPCTGKKEVVTYDHETINHFVFIGETEQKWIGFGTLKNNVTEIV